MSRSKNSRKGSTNKGAGRHACCGKGCSWCDGNKSHATTKQKGKGAE